MIKYKMVCETDDITFETKVNNSLKEGWQLYGNPFSNYDPESQRFYCFQAMIKETK